MTKTRKSVRDRVRVTRTGKVLRRAMALGHARGNKSATQLRRKELSRGLDDAAKIVRKYL
ncbi:MAG: 50S ribosomal protein L35 [Candidatus Jorgensenbacteria bacterium]|nr:50S ribosomal protein L35 [Candidatus Jorgensenbacteria bacterium]